MSETKLAAVRSLVLTGDLVTGYDSEDNGMISWDWVKVDGESLADSLRKALPNVDDFYEQHYGKVRITIEVLEPPTPGVESGT